MANRHSIQDSVLYKLKSRRRLSDVLFADISYIESLQARPPVYSQKWKPKTDSKSVWLSAPPPEHRASDYRPISLPPPNLKKIQGRLATLLSKIEIPDYIFSSVKGVSYVDNAAVHVGSRAFWLLDVEDFFPSCSAHRIAWFFSELLQCSPDVTSILTQITTYEGALPQGAATSPILSYFCNSGMWSDIVEVTLQHSCRISIYADDITISSGVVPKKLIWAIKEILHSNGFGVSARKEKSLVHSPADITGVIVRGHQLLLPNRQRKKLADEVAKRKKSMNSRERASLENRIAGRQAQRRQILGHPKSGRFEFTSG